MMIYKFADGYIEMCEKPLSAEELGELALIHGVCEEVRRNGSI